jgi:hypothetical protein
VIDRGVNLQPIMEPPSEQVRHNVVPNQIEPSGGRPRARLSYPRVLSRCAVHCDISRFSDDRLCIADRAPVLYDRMHDSGPEVFGENRSERERLNPVHSEYENFRYTASRVAHGGLNVS